MIENKKNNKWDKMIESNIQKDEKIKQLRLQRDQLYNYLGQYFDSEDIEKLLQDFRVMDDKQQLNEMVFQLILEFVYSSRVSFKNLPGTVYKTWGILRRESPTVIKSQLLSPSSLKRWGKFRGNFFFKLLSSLYIIMTCPSTNIMYKNDGTDRNKDNLYGHVLEYKLQESVKQSFKTCEIDEKLIDIGHFGKYERSDKVQRVVFNYNQSIGKNAESIYDCTVNAFDDINYYMNIWKQYEPQLISAFGVWFTKCELLTTQQSHHSIWSRPARSQ